MDNKIIDWYQYLKKRVNIVLKYGTILNNKLVVIVSDKGDDEPESQFMAFAGDTYGIFLFDIESIEIIDE